VQNKDFDEDVLCSDIYYCTVSIVSVWLNVPLSRKYLGPEIMISCNWWTQNCMFIFPSVEQIGAEFEHSLLCTEDESIKKF